MRYEIHRVVIKGKEERIVIDDSCETNCIEEYRKHIRSTNSKIIKENTSDDFKPTIELAFTDKLIDK